MSDDQLIVELKKLNEHGLHRSVEILGSFLLSQTDYPTTDTLTQYANALVAREEHRRALQIYRQALQHLNQKLTAAAPKGKSANMELRFKIAQCHFKLKEYEQGIQELKAIPASSRTIAMNLCLARVFHQLDSKRNAITLYKEVLRQSPYAVEAALALIEIGVSVEEILPAYYANLPQGVKWLISLLKSFGLESTFEFKKALAQLSLLEKSFSNNLFLLQSLARCHVRSGDIDKALPFFEKLRMIDPYCLDFMDLYGNILKVNGSSMDLNKLCYDLMNLNSQTRPESWLCVALHCELKGQREKALGLVDRAIALDPRHSVSYLTRGSLLMSLGLAEEAATSFRKAANLQKDLPAYQGLVKAYLTLSRYPDAFLMSKEVYQLMPSLPRAISLHASVLSHYPETRKKAAQLFEDVFTLDPYCVDAVLSLSQLYVWEHQHGKAIELLKKHLGHNNKDVLHIRMAEVLTITNDLSEAMLHFHTALRMNPSSELARQGLERIEKVSDWNSGNGGNASANTAGSGASATGEEGASATGEEGASGAGEEEGEGNVEEEDGDFQF